MLQAKPSHVLSAEWSSKPRATSARLSDDISDTYSGFIKTINLVRFYDGIGIAEKKDKNEGLARMP